MASTTPFLLSTLVIGIVSATLSFPAHAGETNTAPAKPDSTIAVLKQRIPKVIHPWKTKILTSTFFMSDNSNQSDNVWSRTGKVKNGVSENSKSNSSYSYSRTPANPYYIALPFNDLAHPEEAKKWVPPAWTRSSKDGKPISSCKGRWVQIKNVQGRSCYAQWEDVGPIGDSDAGYVFGSNRPEGAGPGLDVSPAVAHYLNLEENSTVAWRFVAEEEVRPGEWLRFEEKGLPFRKVDPHTVSSENSSPMNRSAGKLTAYPAKTP